MRIILLYLVFLLTACKQKKTQDNNVSARKQTEDSLVTNDEKNILEHVRKTYSVGDLNNDKHADTAYVMYDRSIQTDSTIEKKCVTKNCEVTIKFTGNIPDLIIYQSLGIYIQKTEDLNNDGANEMILYSEWFEGYWYNIYLWTFKNGKWKEIGRTKAMLSGDKDYKSRIIKINSRYYLIGDGWDESKGGLTKRSIKIKIG